MSARSLVSYGLRCMRRPAPQTTFLFSHNRVASRQILCITKRPLSSAAGGSDESDKKLLIMRKKMKHQARSRQDGMLADFLVGFVEEHGNSLDDKDLEDWQNLLSVDCETLMNLAAEKDEVPPELDTALLKKVQVFLAAGPPRPGMTGDSPWNKN
eukprot:TRINITY_DN18038_c1_g2_i1.p1 TRINITY_DN18038_c1_g2~~TRINITY_DN18038_c1_g2_i1.p1  ORF type:complete len:155 (+),score=23.76 TRINITY_DN18038_c1_g2_i1:124-588(+)